MTCFMFAATIFSNFQRGYITDRCDLRTMSCIGLWSPSINAKFTIRSGGWWIVESRRKSARSVPATIDMLRCSLHGRPVPLLLCLPLASQSSCARQQQAKSKNNTPSKQWGSCRKPGREWKDHKISEPTKTTSTTRSGVFLFLIGLL